MIIGWERTRGGTGNGEGRGTRRENVVDSGDEEGNGVKEGSNLRKGGRKGEASGAAWGVVE